MAKEGFVRRAVAVVGRVVQCSASDHGTRLDKERGIRRMRACVRKTGDVRDGQHVCAQCIACPGRRMQDAKMRRM